MAKPRLLDLGGGHASLPLLAQASRLDADVTLVSDCPDLWYSGMTPEWTGGVYTHADVTIDLAAICTREGVRFVQGRAQALNLVERRVSTSGGEVLPYDLLAVDVGAANPGDPAGVVHTKPLHRIDQLGSLESGRLVVVGGGAAGVEVALNLTARRPHLHVTIVEPGDRLLSGLPARASDWAHQLLVRRGADVRLGAQAEAVEPGGVRLTSDERLQADAVLWATGSVGQPWLGASGLATTEKGFVRVRPTLLAQSDSRVFVAGDAAGVEGHEDLPRIGVHAVKQGPLLARNVGRTLEALGAGGEVEAADLEPFRPYPIAPLIVSTGEPWAFAVAGSVAVRGRWALGLKHLVDRRWMAKYRVHAPSYRSWIDLAHARPHA
jgi:NADH dehydrogenase FAD-containing subunit